MRIARDGFIEDFREFRSIGCKPWQNFANALLDLNEQIKVVEKTWSPQEAMKLSAYLNVIDGMSHNTGSFMGKFFEEEGNPRMFVFDKVDELNRIRDATRLDNPQDVINLMMQYSDEVPSEYRDLIRRNIGTNVESYQQRTIQDSLKALEESQKRNLKPEPNPYDLDGPDPGYAKPVSDPDLYDEWHYY